MVRHGVKVKQLPRRQSDQSIVGCQYKTRAVVLNDALVWTLLTLHCLNSELFKRATSRAVVAKTFQIPGTKSVLDLSSANASLVINETLEIHYATSTQRLTVEQIVPMSG
jgi:hypothetical protein